MAIAFVKNGGAVASKTATLSFTLTVPAGGHALGNLVVVALGLGLTGSGGTTSCSDARGNTYSQLATTNGGGTALVVYGSILTTALIAGDLITLADVSPGFGQQQGAVSAEWSGATLTQDFVAATANASTTTPTVGPKTPTQTGDLLIGSAALNGPTGDTYAEDTDTVDGTWTTLVRASTSGGSATTNQIVEWGYKISSGTSAQTWNPVFGTARSGGQALVGLRAASVVAPEKAGALKQPLVRCQAVNRTANWMKRRSGIVVPRLWTPVNA